MSYHDCLMYSECVANHEEVLRNYELPFNNFQDIIDTKVKILTGFFMEGTN